MTDPDMIIGAAIAGGLFLGIILSIALVFICEGR